MYDGLPLPIRYTPHEHHRSLFYWQQLHETYRRMFVAAPTRPVLAIYQFCGAFPGLPAWESWGRARALTHGLPQGRMA
jgi:hypothetical protein